MMDLTPQIWSLEQALLGAVVTYPDAQAHILPVLPTDLFFDPRHKAIGAALRALYEGGEGIDPLSLDLHLTQQGQNEAAGGSEYVLTLPLAVSTSANAVHHLRQLKRHWRRYRQQQLGEQLAQLAQQTDRDPAELAQIISDRLLDPIWNDPESPLTGEVAAELALTEYEQAEALAQQGRPFAGLDCGFAGLNETLNGLRPGELTVLAARPSVGKTTLSLQIALHVLQNEAAPVGFVTLEMTPGQIASRLACILADVDPDDQRRGRLSPADREAYVRATTQLARLPLRLYTQDRTVSALTARLAESTPKDGVRLWIVDHLHRITQNPTDQTHDHLTQTAQRLADLAVEHNVHILVLAQLNRQCEDRPDKRPQLADLRGSGSIEEHAVNVLLIYRPGHYEALMRHTPDLASVVEIQAEKTRFGPIGSVLLHWDRQRALFANPPLSAMGVSA